MRYRFIAVIVACLVGVASVQSMGPATSAATSTTHTSASAQRPQIGSDQSPLVVRVSPAPKTATEVAEEAAANKIRDESEKKKDDRDQQLVDFNGELAEYTLALVVVGVIQAALLTYQLFFIPKSFKESRRAGDIARESMVVSNRAYTHYDGCIWRSHTELKDGQVFWRISPRWKNGGNTPTRHLRVFVSYELRDTPLPEDFNFQVPKNLVEVAIVIGPKDSVLSSAYDLFGSDLIAIREGKKHFYIWGVVRYRDVFEGTSEHITRFCVAAMNITGDPTKKWHDEDNRLGIDFTTYHRHNCADEECKG